MNDTIEKLNIQVSSNATKAISSLNKLSASLDKLSASVEQINVGRLDSLATSLNKISNVASGMKSTGVSTLSKNLNKLSSVDTSKVSSSLEKLSEATTSFSSKTGDMSGMKSFSSGIRSITNASAKLDSIDFEKVSENIQKLTKAIKPLTDEMIRGGGATSNYGTQMKEFVNATKIAQNVKGGTKKGFYGEGKMAFQLFNLQSIAGMARQVGNVLGGAITRMNSYVENINLFTVAMGEYAEEGRKFAEEMEFKLGVDSGEAMRQMGFFQQLQTSFGTTADKAYLVSKNLTALGYDIASFYNLNTEEAFLKLQSGLAGKIFCLVCRGLHTVTRLNGGTPIRTIPC